MDLILIILPILLVDVVNPILLAGTIYSLGSQHAIQNGLVVLLSYFLTYFLAGVIIALTLENFTDYLHLPPYFDYVLELAVACLLFYMAWKQYREGDTHPEKKLSHKKYMSLFEAALLGFQINLIGLPFTVPYLAAIDQILKAGIDYATTLAVLGLYNILYILPYGFLILIRIVRPRESEQIFGAVNNWMHRLTAKWMPLLFFILGLLLVEDAISFLIGYREYSFLELL